MASRDLLVFENGRTKRRVSSSETLDFLSVKIGASGLEIKESSGAFDFSAKKLTNISNAVVDTDAAGWGQVKDYVAQQAVAGGTVKQQLLTQQQLSDTLGIIPGTVVYIATQPTANDTITLKDAAGNTESWTFVAARAGANEVTIGGSAAVTMSNLAAAIMLDSARFKGYYDASQLDSIYPDGLVGIYRSADANNSFKVWVGQAGGTIAGYVANYYNTLEYKSDAPIAALGTSEPTNPQSGFAIAKASLDNGEIHNCIAEDKLKSWDGDYNNGAGQWFTMSEGVIPVATAGSNGATLGKATFDTDYGLTIAGIGVARAKVDGSSLEFDPTVGATKGEIRVKADGVTKTHINSDVAGAGLVQATGGELDVNVVNSTIEIATDVVKVKDAGITAAKLNSDVFGAGIVPNGTTNAIDVNVDDSTIEIATDVVQVKDAGITAAKLNSDVFGAGIVANGTTNAIDVNVDNSTLEIATDVVKVKDAGVTAAKLNSDVFGAGIVPNGTTNAIDVSVGDGIQILSDAVAADYSKSFTNDNAGSITIRQVVYVKSNGKVDLAQANVAALPDAEIGLVSDATIAAAASGKIIVRKGAVIGGFTGLTPGKKQYVSRATAGALTEPPLAGFVAGEFVYCVGRAVSATEVEFCPVFELEY